MSTTNSKNSDDAKNQIKKWAYLMNQKDKFTVDETIIADYKMNYRYKDAMQLSAAWAMGNIAESDFTILYAIAVLKVCHRNDILEFLRTIKPTDPDDGPLIQNIEVENYVDGALRRLYNNGLVYNYRYYADSATGGDVSLYTIPKIGLSAMNARQGRNIKCLELRELRPVSDVVGDAAAAHIALSMFNDKAFLEFEENTIYRSRDLGTVQYGMEIKTMKDNVKNFIGFDHLYGVFDKVKFSRKSFEEYMERKLQFVFEYLEKRAASKDGEARGNTYFVLAFNDFDNDIKLFDKFMCMPKHSEWRNNAHKVYFTSTSVLDNTKTANNVYCRMAPYKATQNAKGEIVYTPSGMIIEKLPFLSY